MAERALRVWVLSDGRAGHYNQSRGIVSALQTLGPVETAWVEVRLRLGLARSLLRRRLNRAPAPRSLALLKLLCRFEALPESPCDVIVSTGGRTSFANAWLAALHGVPNIYAGSLRGLNPKLFGAVLTLEPVAGTTNNLVLPLPPSAVDAAGLDAAGARLRARLGAPGARYWTLLIGGDGAGYRYRPPDWEQLLKGIRALADRHGIRWLVAGSRRTGRVAERLLRERLGERAVWQSWYGAGTEVAIDELLGAAERVFVTEDSMTMLTEAIYSRRPVYSLAPQQAAPDTRFEQALQRFAAQGWVVRLAMAALAADPGQVDLQQCRPLCQSPTLTLAERLEPLILRR